VYKVAKEAQRDHRMFVEQESNLLSQLEVQKNLAREAKRGLGPEESSILEFSLGMHDDGDSDINMSDAEWLPKSSVSSGCC
jgi:hypothetical protein